MQGSERKKISIHFWFFNNGLQLGYTSEVKLQWIQIWCMLGGSLAQWLVSILDILDPAAPEEKIVDVAEINQQRCLEESDSCLKMLIKPI